MPGGPVRLGRRLYIPVIDASADPWRFSVFVLRNETWNAMRAPLNRSTGNAQGTLSAAGGAVWATWQENRPRDDGLFDTHMYAQRVAPERGPARELWAGTSIGPGSMEAVEAAGRRWVLYMPAAKGRKALSVAVEPLP
jgi:hypothetical protein